METHAQLAGKTALVTGGESGIGRSIVELFVANGAKVHVIGLNEPQLDEVRRELGHDSVSNAAADVTDEHALADAITAGADRWGNYDIIVSNAGIGCTVAPIERQHSAEFLKVLHVHVLGAFHTLKHATPLVADGGSVVITSSTAGLSGYAETAPYVAAKHAQVGLMRTAYKELASRGIRVNTLNPGPTQTALQDGIAKQSTGHADAAVAAQAIAEGIPLGRYNTPEEIAGSVLYLASDLSKTVTGTTLVVDGGFLG
ncbi:SDR family NAD(P)-dependent oxidoreductase [Brevibacterium atlanticum]|uniref:SDR family NAD(P)-dependent oxidoreductase n=1 Tax=Brevibacterium atlanticum TaxID=2697563 RepID=UPI001423DA6A|nr:SDR family NAD(P)-dependent oxidoreductase [Brevibacterium atlanticum]